MIPKCGRLVGFNAASFHGVKAVRRGVRCAMALWFTMNPNFKELARSHAKKVLHTIQGERDAQEKLSQKVVGSDAKKSGGSIQEESKSVEEKDEVDLKAQEGGRDGKLDQTDKVTGKTEDITEKDSEQHSYNGNDLDEGGEIDQMDQVKREDEDTAEEDSVQHDFGGSDHDEVKHTDVNEDEGGGGGEKEEL